MRRAPFGFTLMVALLAMGASSGAEAQTSGAVVVAQPVVIAGVTCQPDARTLTEASFDTTATSDGISFKAGHIGTMRFACAVPAIPAVTVPMSTGGTSPLDRMSVSYKDYDGPCTANGGCAGGISVCLNQLDLATGQRSVVTCIDSDAQPASATLGAGVKLPQPIEPLGDGFARWFSVEIRRSTTTAGVDFHGLSLTRTKK